MATQKTIIKTDVLLEIWRNDIESFAKFFFPHLLTKKNAEFHKQMYRDLSARYPFLAYEVFRGGAKTTIGLIIKPIHFALFDQIGDISLISKSESFILNEVMRKIKAEFEQNEDLRAIFGDLRTPKWSESYFVLKNGIAFEGKGIDGQLRGGRRGLICLDDLEDEESVLSEEQRDKLRRRISKELIPKLLPGGQMIYFGTPVHKLAYIHQIIETPDNGWVKRIVPCYKDGIEQEGNEAWPEMFPHSRLQEIKRVMGTHYFITEMLCNPTSEQGAPIKDNQIRYWTELPQQYSCVITVDPAYSEDEKADYKVACVVAIDQNSNRYLVSYLRTHQPQREFINGILNLYQQFKNFITAVGIPASGTEKEFFNSVLKIAQENKIYAPFVELKNTFMTASGEAKRNKLARIIASLQPLFEAGKYYIHPNHIEARDELLSIGSSRYDDICDCLAYAEQILSPNIVFDSEINNQYQKTDLSKVNQWEFAYGY